MTFEIRISDQAKQDLENIYGYIAYDLQSPQIAAELLQRLGKAIMGLDEMPERHRLYE